MKVIIAGSRSLAKGQYVLDAVRMSMFKITEVVSGGAQGVDQAGEKWASTHNIPVKKFPVSKKEWENLTAVGARIRRRADGSAYNENAGHDRNQKMANYADALIAIWDWRSPGTRDMIKRAKLKGIPVYIHRVGDNG